MTVYDLFLLEHEMRIYVECSGATNIFCEKVLYTLSYEPLTHTSASSEAAIKRCGGDVVCVTAKWRNVQKKRDATGHESDTRLLRGRGRAAPS